MADKSKISYVDATWNPITGCSVESPGCKNCYAMKLAGTRLKHHPSRAGLTVDTKNGPVWTGEVRLNPEWLDQPIRWRRQRQIFVCAHGDLFHPAVPDDWIDLVFGVMWACLYGKNGEDGHIFMVLTKRSARMREYMSQDRRQQWADAAVAYGGGSDPDGLHDQIMGFDGPHPRIMMGVTVEDQARADLRLPDLDATPAALRWVSVEPMLGPVKLRLAECLNGCGYVTPEPANNGKDLACPHCKSLVTRCGAGNRHGGLLGKRQIDLVIVGGESIVGSDKDNDARPMHPHWVRDLRDECEEAGVEWNFKQWGQWLPWLEFQRAGVEDDTEQTRFRTVIWQDRWVDCGYPIWCDMRDNYGGGAESPQDPDQIMGSVGKKASGRLFDGKTYDSFPV